MVAPDETVFPVYPAGKMKLSLLGADVKSRVLFLRSNFYTMPHTNDMLKALEAP